MRREMWQGEALQALGTDWVWRGTDEFPAPGWGGELDGDVICQTQNKEKEQIHKEERRWVRFWTHRIECASGATKKKFWGAVDYWLTSLELWSLVWRLGIIYGIGRENVCSGESSRQREKTKDRPLGRAHFKRKAKELPSRGTERKEWGWSIIRKLLHKSHGELQSTGSWEKVCGLMDT